MTTMPKKRIIKRVLNEMDHFVKTKMPGLALYSFRKEREHSMLHYFEK